MPTGRNFVPFYETEVSPTGRKKLKLSMRQKFHLQEQKKCNFLWDRSLTYREKKIVLPMRHELAYRVKMWTYMLRISISFICMKYMLLLFFMNNVALDSQFYNGEIKSYLLPFFLDPKNNFQTEILCTKYQNLKSPPTFEFCKRIR